MEIKIQMDMDGPSPLATAAKHIDEVEQIDKARWLAANAKQDPIERKSERAVLDKLGYADPLVKPKEYENEHGTAMVRLATSEKDKSYDAMEITGVELPEQPKEESKSTNRGYEFL